MLCFLNSTSASGKNDSCKAMTFVKHPDANGGICWQKGSVPSPSADQTMGLRYEALPQRSDEDAHLFRLSGRAGSGL